jgi:hypothetical protein
MENQQVLHQAVNYEDFCLILDSNNVPQFKSQEIFDIFDVDRNGEVLAYSLLLTHSLTHSYSLLLTHSYSLTLTHSLTLLRLITSSS